MKYLFISIILLMAICRLSHCKISVSDKDSTSVDSSAAYSVYVVNHGWHTGVVMQRNDFICLIGLDSIRIPAGKWLEFGWGDKDFYMSTPSEDDVEWFTTLKAAIWPTSSVVHVVGFNRPVPEYFSYSGLIGLHIADSLRESMAKYISKAFSRRENGTLDSLGQGLYGNSCFFSGQEKYYFPKTCNVWTAQVLKRGGIDLSPFSCQKSKVLMDRLVPHGKEFQRLKE